MDTSLMAYLEIQHKVIPQCNLILNCFEKRGSMTREEIMEETGLKINVVTARVNELLKKDRIEVIGYRPSFSSKKQVEVLKIK